VGKTTAARIIKDLIGCHDMDFREINAAENNGVDFVRGISDNMRLSSLVSGKSKVYVFDESQNLTNDAQTVLLKMTENAPKHVYFIFCTTHPQKMLTTLKNRCTEIQFKSIPDSLIKERLEEVMTCEKKTVVSKVIQEIVENSEGSMRKALVLLEKVLGIEYEADQLQAITNTEAKSEAIQIARAIIGFTNPSWSEVQGILKSCNLKEAEGIRRMILSYAKSVLLGGNKVLQAKAYLVIETFRFDYFAAGEAGLVADCYTVVSGGK
jgi:DNA polymerase-3 subunit gamma/tau